MYRRHMRKPLQRFCAGPGELVVLGLLTRAAMHGYQIVRALCEPGKKVVYILCMGEGTLYPLLHRLETRGCIKGQWLKVGERRRQRQYRITPKGRREYAGMFRCWTSLAAAVHKICAGAR